MSDHHKTLPPSSFPALKQCKQYVSAKRSGPEAERGTRAHAIHADILRQGSLGSFRAEDIEYVALADWSANQIIGIMHVRGIEERVVLSDGFEEITFGRLDAWGYSKDDPNLLCVADMKTGKQRDHRPQIMVYALAKMDELDVDECRIFITYPDLKAVEDYVVTRDEAERETFAIIERVNDPEHNPPTECDYCNFCAKQSTCPVWVIPARCALQLVSTPPENLASVVATLEALKTEPAMLGRFLGQWRKAKKLVEKAGLEEWAKGMLEAGEEVPGWKLSKVSGARCFTEEDIEKLLAGPIRDMGTARARKFVSVGVKEFEDAWSLYSDQPLPVPPSGEKNGYNKLIADKKKELA